MEIITFLFIGAAVVAAIYIARKIFAPLIQIVIGCLLFPLVFAPVLVGISYAIESWRSGHDNLAVVVAVSGLGVTVVFWNIFEKSGHIFDKWLNELGLTPKDSSIPEPRHWSDGKRQRYDVNGKIIGYEDKD